MNGVAPPQRYGPGKKAAKSKGELLFDVLLVIGIAAYLAIAKGYPAIGRQVPMIVGSVALIVAVVQLIGYFVPGLWAFTHGDTTKGEVRLAPADGHGTPVAVAAVAAEKTEESPVAPGHEARDTSVAVAWAGGFLIAILVLGYVIAVPGFFLVYFGARRSWRLAIISAVVMGLITRFLFEGILGIPLPTGVLPPGWDGS